MPRTEKLLLKVYDLQKWNKGSADGWYSEDLYASYQAAQLAFIHRDGKFQIIERKVIQ